MCGIFGIFLKDQALTDSELWTVTNDLFRLSESRGKESAGIAVQAGATIQVYKQPLSASEMIRQRDFKTFFQQATHANGNTGELQGAENIGLIGHSRLVTNGSQENHENNQPVIKDGIVCIHNGIIVNDSELWAEFPHLERHFQVDTEIIISLMRSFNSENANLLLAFRKTFQLLRGTASIATLFADQNVAAIATNNGSLYTSTSTTGDIMVFASEEYILSRLLKRKTLQSRFSAESIQAVGAGYGVFIDTNTIQVERFNLNGDELLHKVKPGKGCQRTVRDDAPRAERTFISRPFENITITQDTVKHLAIDPTPIMGLRRCTRCVLPETMPFIEFDEEGVCNFCRTYPKYTPEGEDALMAEVEKYRRSDGKPDCIITLSGGRDSSYGLHYVKNVLKMNPIAYTYDWGMITDLARRNQARLCGQLGIEHILVSADINQKREYIRKNVNAWLKQPHLGMIPLFMAGDKQYFYYANQMKQQLDIELTIIASNPFEETFFKFGFCGIKPYLYRSTIKEQLQLLFFYGGQYLTNPAYLNDSIWDTLWAFSSFYIIPHNYLGLYKYIDWDEDKITSTLIQQYEWETATDTRQTWRIGDGTAAFYNYIYYALAGFSENDTFRSNQIREGRISRERALEMVHSENQPRFESIQWYCNTIGVDMETTLTQILAAPKLYPTPR